MDHPNYSGDLVYTLVCLSQVDIRSSCFQLENRNFQFKFLNLLRSKFALPLSQPLKGCALHDCNILSIQLVQFNLMVRIIFQIDCDKACLSVCRPPQLLHAPWRYALCNPPELRMVHKPLRLYLRPLQPRLQWS